MKHVNTLNEHTAVQPRRLCISPDHLDPGQRTPGYSWRTPSLLSLLQLSATGSFGRNVAPQHLSVPVRWCSSFPKRHTLSPCELPWPLRSNEMSVRVQLQSEMEKKVVAEWDGKRSGCRETFKHLQEHNIVGWFQWAGNVICLINPVYGIKSSCKQKT